MLKIVSVMLAVLVLLTAAYSSEQTCDDNPCHFFQDCIPDSKACALAPCPQYRCEDKVDDRSCEDKPCQPGEICEEDTKACLVPPCPQYKCTKQ